MTILRLAKRVPPLPGGQERHILELTREQAAAGHQVLLLYGDGDQTGGDGWSARQVAPARTSGSETWLSVRFGRDAARWVARHRPDFDLVHAHGDWPEALAAARIGRACGRPAVVTCHAAFGSQGFPYDWLRRRAFGRLDHIFAVCGTAADQLRELGVTVPIEVQHSGTRTALLAAVPRQEAPPPKLVAVGRLAPMKGYHDLLAAVRELLPRWPELQVDILGGGELSAELRAAAADLRGVRFHGDVGRDEVYRALRQAWVYVLSSVDLPRIMEGMPTTVIEAVAAGVPVVSTAVAGVPEVVQDGVHGLLVPQREPRALAAAIDRLLGDDELRRRIGRHNEEVGRSFDWAAVARVFTDFCERLAAR